MTADLRKGVFKIFLLGLAALFALPLATWLFVRYAEPQRDSDYLAAIERSIDQDPQLSAQQRDDQKAFFRANPPSSTCDNDAPRMARYRAAVCAPYSELWQFHLARKVSFWTLVAAATVLLVVAALGAEPVGSTPPEFGAFVRAEHARWSKVIREKGIRSE